jgi:putative Ca2+/H+ antiporter (TMEM165/GDT1 family)
MFLPRLKPVTTSLNSLTEPSSESTLTSTSPAPEATSPPLTGEPNAAEAAKSSDRAGFWTVFVSTFATIFLAELGDKTQVATLLMSAESGKPWIVFLGAGTALVATSLLGVLVGRWLARRVSPRTLDTAAGAMLLLITLWLLWDVAAMT